MMHRAHALHGMNPALVRQLMTALLGALFLVWPTTAQSTDGPIAPCGSVGPALYPAFADPPNTGIWQDEEINADWEPGACIEWGSRRFTILTAFAARFRFAGNVDEFLQRFATQSAWRGIKYWSVTDGRWDTLITDAGALSGADSRFRRLDFTLPELKSGKSLYFLHQDNRSPSAVIYRMRIVSADADRLIVTMENVSSVSLFHFTLFNPGDLEASYIFVRLTPTTWGYYNLSGAREGIAMVGEHGASYLNRAAAIYRHLIGVPTDQEPPLRPVCPIDDQC